MAISYVGAGTAVTGINPTVPLPSGIQEKDYLLIFVAASILPSTPAGWTSRNINASNIVVYSKPATGTESSVVLTASSTSTNAVMVAYRGVSTVDVVNTSSATTGTSVTTATLTTTYANEYVVSFFGASTTGTWTAPASTTTQINIGSNGTVRGMLLVDEAQATAGVSTARTATYSASSTAISQLAISLIPSGRYWVGGTSTWDTTTTTGWSFSSGGSSGAPVPTANDPVYFDQASTYTTTLTGTLVCFGLTVSAGTVTFISTGTIANSGSLSLVAGTVWSGTGVHTFNSTSTGRTIQTNAVTLAAPLTFNGVAGSWILQGAVTTSRALAGAVTLTNGTLDLNGYTATLSASATATFLTATGTKNLTFNGGTLAIAASGTTAFNNAVPTGFTTTDGTGTGSISLTSASTKTFVGGGSTFNCTLNQGGAGSLGITGANTFNNITATYTSTAATTIAFPVSTTTTVNAFTASGTSGKLLSLDSNTGSPSATVALAGGGNVTTDYLSVADIDFTPFATNGTAPYKWYGGTNSSVGPNVTGMLFAASTVVAYVLASNSSFTTPADWNNSNNTIHIFGAGGGGGGGLATSGTNHAGGGGGGGGGYTQLTNQSISGSVSYSIGAGGTAGAAAGGTGGTGGTTTWNTTNTALGGTGGSTTAVPTSAGGLGGVGTTATGGAGGAGSTNTTTQLAGAGGGGGAAGPNGTGAVGGAGTSGAFGTAGGGGGGGNGGGSAGAVGSTRTGGNNSAGVGGGAAGGNAGTRGGGGGGNNANAVGGVGGIGVDILNSIVGGGGAGGTAGNLAGATNTAYGGGGAGGNTSSSTTGYAGGAGGPGLIVIVYVPGASTPSSGSFFFFF